MAHRTKGPRQIDVEPLWVVARQSTDVVAVEDPDVAAALRFIRENAKGPIGVDHVVEQVALLRRALEIRFQRRLGRSTGGDPTRAAVVGEAVPARNRAVDGQDRRGGRLPQSQLFEQGLSSRDRRDPGAVSPPASPAVGEGGEGKLRIEYAATHCRCVRERTSSLTNRRACLIVRSPGGEAFLDVGRSRGGSRTSRVGGMASQFRTLRFEPMEEHCAVKRQRAVRPYRLQRRHDQSRNGGGRIGPEFGADSPTDPHGLRPHVACRRRLGPDDCRRRRLDDPNIASDLAAFNTQFGLATCSFTKLNQNGVAGNYPTAAGTTGWSLESPWTSSGPTPSRRASIILVETNSDNLNDLLTGVNTARNLSGARWCR